VGKAPITVSFHPGVLVGLTVLAIALPTAWINQMIQTYADRNRQLIHNNDQLQQKNNLLAEEAIAILERVEALEEEIEQLQQRAGVDGKHNRPTTRTQPKSQGGTDWQLRPEELLAAAETQLMQVLTDFERQVQPAVEQTLEREAARPQNPPIKVHYEQTSGFGLRRSPFGGGYEFHRGLDFVAAYGAPIHVTAPGVVQVAEFSPGYGYHVIVDHGYGYRTLYAHLSKLAVTPGNRIERDRIVGYLGNTGRSTGPHLHYSVYRNHVAVDPTYYLSSPPNLLQGHKTDVQAQTKPQIIDLYQRKK
jgi:murein DD-endopeptidase MepM/ murein hydrolase activator NlpD